MHRKSFLLVTVLFSFLGARASDTLRINVIQADSLFLAKNFYLLASSMNIEAQKAKVIQAKLYPNPTFAADLNVYDPTSERFFHVGQSGQKVFQVEQLILLGGKRKLEIEMAKSDARIAELEFRQLVRQLKFKLHSDLFAAGQQQLLLTRYNSQLSLLDTLLNAYQLQAIKGNMPLKDVVRLKGAYLKLNNDRAELYKQYYETQANLQTLLQTQAIIDFNFSEKEIEHYIKYFPLQEIQLEALTNRPELLIINEDKILSEQYLKYQRRLVIPDVSAFTSYDQRGGAFNNQINAGIAIQLPFWNRNQGNVKYAQYKNKEVGYHELALKNEIMSVLQNSYGAYTQTVSEYKKANALYNQDFEITVKGMTDNFQKRNVSIIEFIDFFEAYNEVLTELTRIKTQLVISGEHLNLLIGKDIY